LVLRNLEPELSEVNIPVFIDISSLHKSLDDARDHLRINAGNFIEGTMKF